MLKKQLFADRLLAQMPSLRALRCFVTAARYESFTQAAEVLESGTLRGDLRTQLENLAALL